MANKVSPDEAYDSAMQRTNALIPQRQAFNQWQLEHTIDLEKKAQEQVEWERQQYEAQQSRSKTGSIIGGALSGAVGGAMAGSMAGPWGALAGGVAGAVGGGVAGAYGGSNAQQGVAAIPNLARVVGNANAARAAANSSSTPFTNGAGSGVGLNQFTPAPAGMAPPSSSFTGSGGAQFSIPASGKVSNPINNKEEDPNANPFTKKAKKLAKGQ